MSYLRKSIINAISDRLGEIVIESAAAAIKAGAFDRQIEDMIISTARQRDDGLSRIGFVTKIAIELMDKSNPRLSFSRAKTIAADVYQTFRRDNGMVLFGDPAWDWSGVAARILANEYEIEHWEQAP